jgi:transposase-like protein
LLQPYARRQVDLGEVAVALYAAGVSQRKAAEGMSLLLGHRYTHETISAITDQVLKEVEAFRHRPKGGDWGGAGGGLCGPGRHP